MTGTGGGGAVGKKVSALVQEQLQYCRSLRRADMLSAVQVRTVCIYHPAHAQQQFARSTQMFDLARCTAVGGPL